MKKKLWPLLILCIFCFIIFIGLNLEKKDDNSLDVNENILINEDEKIAYDNLKADLINEKDHCSDFFSYHTHMIDPMSYLDKLFYVNFNQYKQEVTEITDILISCNNTGSIKFLNKFSLELNGELNKQKNINSKVINDKEILNWYFDILKRIENIASEEDMIDIPNKIKLYYSLLDYYLKIGETDKAIKYRNMSIELNEKFRNEVMGGYMD